VTPSSNGRVARLPGLLAILAGAAPLAAAAQSEVVGANCLQIEDGQERLACFDRAIGTAVRGSAATAGTPAASAAMAATPDQVPSEEPLASAAASLIDTAWGLLPDSKRAYVRLHRPNYILFGRYTTDVNTAPYRPLFDAFEEEGEFGSVEAKFQISVKGRLFASDDRRWGLWFAYTQQNQWQVFEEDISRPFRETNYEPELFGSFHPDLDLGGWRLNLVTFGYNHQSNGRADPISRSWDRLFVEAAVERGNLVLQARAWTRIRLGDAEDDNPDIVDYYGNAELNALYRWRGSTFTLMGRGNPATGKGAAQFTWASRPLLGPLRGYVQLFTGYGESMIDYDWNQTTIGVGVSLNERF
jgi:phospholipase A1